MSRNRLPAGHLLRRFTLGSGPLKRSSDRLEFVARVLLVCSLLTAVPIGLAVGTAAHTHAVAQVTAQAADRHRVTATLMADVPATAYSGSDGAWATAVWSDPAGIEHRFSVPVPARARAGDPVSVWIDRDGNRTTRPLSDEDVTGQAVGQGALTFALLSLIAAGAYRSFRRLLDRSRLHRWAADWAVVEPVWTRRVP